MFVCLAESSPDNKRAPLSLEKALVISDESRSQNDVAKNTHKEGKRVIRSRCWIGLFLAAATTPPPSSPPAAPPASASASAALAAGAVVPVGPCFLHALLKQQWAWRHFAISVDVWFSYGRIDCCYVVILSFLSLTGRPFVVLIAVRLSFRPYDCCSVVHVSLSFLTGRHFGDCLLMFSPRVFYASRCCSARYVVVGDTFVELVFNLFRKEYPSHDPDSMLPLLLASLPFIRAT